MVTEELLSYIKQQLADGFTRKQVGEALADVGWSMVDVEEALSVIDISDKPQDSMQSSKTSVSQRPVMSAGHLSTKTVTESGDEPLVMKTTSPRFTASQPSVETPPAEKSAHGIWQEKDKKSHKTRVLMIVTSVLFVALVSAGGVFAYVSFFKKLSPDEVFARMFKALPTATSNKLNTKFSINLEAESAEMGSGELQVAVTSSGGRDFSDLENIKAEGNTNFEINASSGPFGVNFELDVDIKVLNSVVYVRLNKITNLPIPVDLSSVKGEWVKIDPKELKEEFGVAMSALSDSKRQQDTDVLQGVIEENKELRDKALVQLEEFSQELENIATRGVTEGEDEKINGVNTYHYNIVFTKEDWRIIIEKLTEIGMDVASKTGTTTALSVKEFEDFKSSDEFDQLLDILAMIKAEVWIGKKDFLPYRTIVELKLDEFKFDDPLSVAREKARQAGLKANLSSMRPSAEIFYDSNNNSYGAITKLGICPESGSAGSMFTQNRSIASAIRSIKTITDDEVYCVAADGPSGAQKYAISAPFKDVSDSWCVDSSGFFGSGVASEDAKCGEYIFITNDIATKSGATLNGNILFKYSASDYNKPITVEVPESSIPVTDVIRGFTGGTLESIGVAREKARIATAHSFLSGALPAAVICVYDNQNLKKPENVNTGGGGICKGSVSDWPALPEGWSYDGPDTDIAPDVTSNIAADTFTYAAYGDELVVTCTENGCVRSK